MIYFFHVRWFTKQQMLELFSPHARKVVFMYVSVNSFVTICLLYLWPRNILNNLPFEMWEQLMHESCSRSALLQSLTECHTEDILKPVVIGFILDLLRCMVRPNTFSLIEYTWIFEYSNDVFFLPVQIIFLFLILFPCLIIF